LGVDVSIKESFGRFSGSTGIVSTMTEHLGGFGGTEAEGETFTLAPDCCGIMEGGSFGLKGA
jgi:hypothetical protein